MLAKCLLLLFAAQSLIIVAQEGQTSPLSELKEKCRKENDLEMEEVVQLNKTKYVETTDVKVKCFIKCILTELKLMNEDGEFTHDDSVIQNLKYKKHFPTCVNSTGADTCEKAVNFQNCMWKEIDADKTPE